MLILILTGFVSEMSLQVSTYVDHAPGSVVLVQAGTRGASRGAVRSTGGKARMTVHIGSKAVLIVGVALAFAVLGIVAGVIPSRVLWLGLILICPLMMFFMMRGMKGGPDGRS